MKEESKFLSKSFFKEGKFGFTIDLDPEDFKLLKLRNGKYRIEAKRPKNNPEKWYLTENTWEPNGGFRPQGVTTASGHLGDKTALLPKDDVWTKAKTWQNENQLSPGPIDTSTLPF
jgi:hypothetical protein